MNVNLILANLDVEVTSVDLFYDTDGWLICYQLDINYTYIISARCVFVIQMMCSSMRRPALSMHFSSQTGEHNCYTLPYLL